MSRRRRGRKERERQNPPHDANAPLRALTPYFSLLSTHSSSPPRQPGELRPLHKMALGKEEDEDNPN